MKNPRHKRANTVGVHLQEASRAVRVAETERTMVAAWGRGERGMNTGF